MTHLCWYDCLVADLIHTSWHETDTYRRVVHLTFGSGSGDGGEPAGGLMGGAEWLRYLLRDRPVGEREASCGLEAVAKL